jgi:hypothetical protein
MENSMAIALKILFIKFSCYASERDFRPRKFN